jgi:hypothetical protein
MSTARSSLQGRMHFQEGIEDFVELALRAPDGTSLRILGRSRQDYSSAGA